MYIQMETYTKTVAQPSHNKPPQGAVPVRKVWHRPPPALLRLITFGSIFLAGKGVTGIARGMEINLTSRTAPNKDYSPAF